MKVQFVCPTGMKPHSMSWSNTHFWPAEWKQYQNHICHWMVQAWWNVMKPHCWLPIAILLCECYFLLFPLGYWFSLLSVELVGPASGPLHPPSAPCQHYFTQDAPVYTENTHPHSHTHTHVTNTVCTCTYKVHANTHLDTHRVSNSLCRINQSICEARQWTGEIHTKL